MLMRATHGSICFFFQAEDGIRDKLVTGVQTCALPIYPERRLIAVSLGAHRLRRACGCLPSRPSTGTSSASLSGVVRLRITSATEVASSFEVPPTGSSIGRSEERRVGKEGRSRWSPYH